MKHVIKKGGHKDLYRIYPMMEFDFPPAELVGQPYLHCAFLKGAADLLLLKDENGLETGYAVVYKKSLYGYVLLAYLSIYPIFRENGAGTRFLELIRERYAGAQGIFLEVTQGDPAAATRRYALYASMGYADVSCDYAVGGTDTTLMCLRLKGKADPAPAAPRIIRDLYTQIVPERYFDKNIRVCAR